MSRTTIGAICSVGDGTHAKIKRIDSGVPYLTCRNIKNGRLELSEVYFISEEDYSKYFLNQRKAITCPLSNDLLFSSIGTIGEPYLVRPLDRFGISSSVAIVRPDLQQVYPKFLYYWIKGPIFQNALYNIKGGVAQGFVSLEMIRSLPLHLPTINIQKKIASVLSAYDDLIENNTRRIAILEEMAQALYREWFVEFRFPGHEKVKLVDSPLGKVPEGWEVGTINDVVKILSGFAFKSETFVIAGRYRLVTIKNVHDGRFNADSDSLLDTLPTKMPEHCNLSSGDILLSLTGNIGRTCMVYGSGFLLNQRVAKLAPLNPADIGFVYCLFRSPETQVRLSNIANGVAQQNLSPIQTGHLALLLPQRRLLDDFSKAITPMLLKIVLLYRQNTNLRQTRDLLLPRLISGELDVEDLDIYLGPAASE